MMSDSDYRTGIYFRKDIEAKDERISELEQDVQRMARDVGAALDDYHTEKTKVAELEKAIVFYNHIQREMFDCIECGDDGPCEDHNDTDTESFQVLRNLAIKIERDKYDS